ncbi:MAG: carboxypeptidase regulatory-like domain-containing protein [Planctomycetes bacterium]|nr:carboxypeptidase regulatory-like domain-containing protein [Planctomycetota bacterium]
MGDARFGLWLLLVSASAPAQDGGGVKVTRDLSGTVTGVVGKERARVTLWLNDTQRHVLEPVAEALAAADGAFVLPGAPWFQKQAWGNRAFMLIAGAGDRVALVGLRGDAASTSGIGLALAPAIELHGVLRDEATGAPIANGWVWPAIFGSEAKIWFTEPMLPWRAETAADGRFTLRGLPPFSRYKLRAGGPDHAMTWIDVEAPQEPIEAQLPRGVRITGTVLLPDGKPAMRVRAAASAHGLGYGTALTDDEGRFQIASLPPGTYKVWAEAEDLTVIAVLDLNLAAGEVAADNQVQLVHGGFIVGRIVDKATGKPFVPGPSTDVAMYGPARGPGGACECTPVLADGTFRIRAPAGTNRIYLRAAGGYAEPSEEVVVVEGQETQVVWQLDRGGRR